MAQQLPSKHDVAFGTEVDAAFILDWLEAEYLVDHEGFWDNRNIIVDAVAGNELYVLRLDGGAVAFQVGHYAPDISCVRQDLQRRGYGTALFEAALERAHRDDVNVLHGECAPISALPFWQKHGFKRYWDHYRRDDHVLVRRFVHRSFVLPADQPRVQVIVSFFPESALYKPESTAPIVSYRLQGSYGSDEIIQLEDRAVAAISQEPNGDDLVVRIEVDGCTRCFGKAKHPDQKGAGVILDWQGKAFYVDRVRLAYHHV